MEWELAIKVATILIGGLTLIDKGYELIKKRRAQRRVYTRPLKSTQWFVSLKKKLAVLYSPPDDLVLLSNYMGAPLLLKKT